jgi:hypothetical protein
MYDRSGIYTVKGVTYIEGQYHEGMLRTDAFCEIFVEVIQDMRVSTQKVFYVVFLGFR